MVSLGLSSSRSSLHSSSSQTSLNYATPGSVSIMSSPSASSSKLSLDLDDEENVTITAYRALSKRIGKRKSSEDIRLLAISTHITELSYAISDIQTRIFEIQELRHKSQSPENADHSTPTNIDQSLMALDERMETLSKGIKNVNETLEPLLRTAATPTVAENGSANENAALIRKHANLMSDWAAVQEESEVLREELKEDKWLTVFRTVTDQADGMMSSLEKAVTRCQEFIWQVHRRGVEDFQSNAALPSSRTEKSPPTVSYETFTTLLESYDAKKKHYMPATSKVLAIIDRGVRDRITKNGETLRRHAESAQRWKSLRERIARTDTELENVRKLILNEETPSEHESTTSGTNSSKNGHLTPGNASQISRVSSSGTNMSGSISPFRKLARKFSGQPKTSPQPVVSPLSVNKKTSTTPSEPSMSPVPQVPTLRRQRTSIFGSMRGTVGPPPVTPEKPSHKHSQSYTPDSSPHNSRIEKPDFNSISISRSAGPSKQRWNSSTKVEPEDRNLTIKGLPRRPPSSSGFYNNNDDIPPVPAIAPSYRRSLSRASMASSRPWSPITSSNSTTQSTSQSVLLHAFRPPSRAQTPSRAFTPSLVTTPRTRPKTPSHIPAPKSLPSISGTRSVGGWDDEDSYFNRSFSPSTNTSPTSAVHPPRPPSRSMIPVPSVHLHTPSRPGSSMSNFTRSESPTMRSFRANALRAQTPEHMLRARAQQVPVFQGTVPRLRMVSNKLPPSSFRDGGASRASSRPSSRNGANTPLMDQPIHEYVPANNYDPLDLEVAAVVNSIPHGLLVERVDPPLKKNQIPKEGEEIKAQYATTNATSGRRVITCRLTTLTRAGKAGGDPSTTKKVMVRVGGGWQDLAHYILNRQAGL
ncbi:hypothetical protein CPC08DRAFT_816795 [Agrocybe pediades]|nr:hypothetical protein CPC08DRAFT_816795 [Agrocybe pediades]